MSLAIAPPAAPRGPAFMTPSRQQLRAAAVWVTIDSWVRGCEQRYGAAQMLHAGAQAAPESSPSGRSTARPLRRAVLQGTMVRSVAETAAKDVRWMARDAAAWRDLRESDLQGVGPFIWQHHDLFQHTGLRLGRRAGLPVVVFVDAPYVWESAQWGVRRPGWSRLAEYYGDASPLRAADLVACVSIEVAEEVERLGVDPERIVVTPCTAEPDDYLAAEDRRTDLGIADTSVIVGWVGSFRSFHNVSMMIEAVARARVDDPRIEVLLVGDGSDLAETLTQATKRGVPVHSTGRVAHREVADYIKTMDIACLTAPAGQGFHYSPVKLKEYLAAGRAIVAPAIGEMQRDLTSGCDVELYPPDDVEAMASTIARLAADPAHRQALGSNAIDTVRRKFSIEGHLDIIEHGLGLAQRLETSNA